MKNWIIIVITLLLTALYVMSVRQASAVLRVQHLFNIGKDKKKNGRIQTFEEEKLEEDF